MGPQQNTDQTDPRDRALEAWIKSAEKEFVGPFQRRGSEPVRAVQDLRKVLEGWAHAMTLILDPEFKPYEGKELHRRDLGKMLAAIVPVLTPELRRACKHVKENSDPANHNNGSPGQASPLLANAPLCSAAALLDDLYRRLHRPRDPEFDRIVSQLLGHQMPGLVGPTAVEGEGSVSSQEGSVLVPVLALSAPRAPSRLAVPLWLVLAGGVGVVSITGLAYWFSGSSRAADAEATGASAAPPAKPVDATAWVRRYEADLASRDVDRIARGMRFPLRRFYLKENVDEPWLRERMVGWFKDHAEVVLFESCVEQPRAPSGDSPVRCDVRAVPPIKGAESATECLVFDRDGLLVSRANVKNDAGCPP